MKKIFIPIIFILGITGNTNGQPASSAHLKDGGQTFTTKENPAEEKKSKGEIKGDKFYFIYDFNQAIKAYAAEENLTVEGQRKLAKSYYNMNQYTGAEEAYSKLVTLQGAEPEDHYNGAMAYRSNGKYEESNKWMDKFSEQRPDDLRARDYLASKDGLNELMTDKGKYKVNPLDINTDAQDFGTSYFKDKVVFASSRTNKVNPKTSYRNGKPYLKMYVSEKDNGQLKSPQYFDTDLNGKMNDGPASFNKAGTFMAYTINNLIVTKKERIVNVEIYFRTFADNKWSEPVPFTLNNSAYSVGHPSLSGDGNTMYFTCNMPGGSGGADLYRSRSNGGEWGTAENLGKEINTEGDEVFPFYEEKSSTLFFASNGRFGLGGLDIFTSTYNGSVFSSPLNAGVPLNSSADDFSIIADSTMTTGYFSSNRTGGKGDDDIYTVNFLNAKKINGIARDKSENPLASIFVTLLNDRDEVLDTVTTGPDGAYLFTVETDKVYSITGKNAKYNDEKISASTTGTLLIVKADMLMTEPAVKEPVAVVPAVPPAGEKKDVTPEPVKNAEPAKTVPVKEAEPKITEGRDLSDVAGFKAIHFDYHLYNIRKSDEPELNKIVKIMNANPEMTIELKSHTDCRSSAEYNQALSDKRAQASANYIRKRISNPERIYGKGYGESELINNCACEQKDASGCSEKEHQKNRRTEFIVIKK